jgi:lysophospholipase L1-like esterase
MNYHHNLVRYGLFTFLTSLMLAPLADAQPRRVQPAEVPAAVTMPRPTEAQLAQAEATLQRLLAGLQGSDKAIFDNFPWLVDIDARPVNTAIVPDLNPRFEEKHQSNLAVARAGNIDVLFMGDSITDWWRNETGNMAGKPVFDQYFGSMKVANFGIAGDTTQGVLYRLQNGEGQGFSPKAIMLMIGTNNTRANLAGEIAEGVGAVVLELQKDFPEAKILLLGVFPRSTADSPLRPQIAEINRIISRLHDGDRVRYLDIGSIFLDQDGNIPTTIMSDGLHPTTAGYELWAQEVIGPLTELIQD